MGLEGATGGPGFNPDDKNYDSGNNNVGEMPGTSYQISSKPDIWITGTPDYKLVEVIRKTREDDSGLLIASFVTRKTFTACKPVRIIKHTNLLSFLELQQRYTIEFRGSEPSGNFIVKQKTIAEIVTELKNGNALCEMGIDVAITAQIKAFEKAGKLEINDDMGYSGFFTNEAKHLIISSNVDVQEIDIQKLREALEFIDELKEIGFANRLDLLAHTVKFGIIAPCSYIFKFIKCAVLEWVHLYGKPNASKSTSGKIILAMDGHHNDDDYNVNVAHADTIARLGDTVSKTTFPKLVDEMDFTDDRKLANNVKSAIDQPRLRKTLDRSRRAEYTPALSALVMTSNPPPPLNDAAFMKRVAARYFPATETHLKNERSAKDFDSKLTSQLDKLETLGRFRNSFIMDNQDVILDKKLTPFEKSIKILIAAYEAPDMLVPCWLIKKELEQNHLEESMEDAKTIILNAFESMIIDKFRNLDDKNELTTIKRTSDRFFRMIDYNMLPFVKRVKDKARQDTDRITIDTGILSELYEYGITKEQLSNLKALADYMGGRWHRTDGKTIVEVSKNQLETYFEENK